MRDLLDIVAMSEKSEQPSVFWTTTMIANRYPDLRFTRAGYVDGFGSAYFEKDPSVSYGDVFYPSEVRLFSTETGEEVTADVSAQIENLDL